ncbi:MAG TPA: bi-domain-containing oxidoreductase [Bacillota bacterium]|nr:bi-domain-containing oxidoreductase [Bacillota bacterium]
MKQVLIKNGQALIEEVPAPLLEKGTLLVRVNHSCISSGTELQGLKTSGLPLWKRALKQPDNVRKVFQTAALHGLRYTYNLVSGKLQAGSVTGYSAAGIVLEVGLGVTDFKPGDPVACAGAQCAHHAEIIRVPRNLAVPVPKGLDFSKASTVALGAIALQGIRRLAPTMGETFVVIGLGILGQLTCQMLQLSGCTVIGIDLDTDRVALALRGGLDNGLTASGRELEQVAHITGGAGADGVIITAAASTDAIVASAFTMCRKKGRVVLVGDVGLKLNRNDIYQKELDFLISSSYGPGRYDSRYEEQGLDYPLGYVRWTENRNMREYLHLLATDKLHVEPLITKIYPVAEAAAAYEELKSGAAKPLLTLLSYPQPASGTTEASFPIRVIANPLARPAGKDQIRIAVVGAGGFAKGMHLPHLQQLSDYFSLRAIVSRTGQNAVAAARQFGAAYATTDYRQVLEDREVDAVLISTRHNLHAQMALAALQAGKHVLVEKPLALELDELDGIINFFPTGESGNTTQPILLTGFNRRFSRFSRRIFELIQDRTNPMICNYRMNAGYLPEDHWIHQEEGGGRNQGEACHIYDLFTYFTGSKVTSVAVEAIAPNTGYYQKNDNFVVTLKFADGSVAVLTYTALGCNAYPKESLEIFVDGKVLALDDYRELRIFGAKDRGIQGKFIDKGQKDELIAFAQAIRQGGPWPNPLWQQVQVTEIAFEVERQIKNRAVCLRGTEVR